MSSPRFSIRPAKCAPHCEQRLLGKQQPSFPDFPASSRGTSSIAGGEP